MLYFLTVSLRKARCNWNGCRPATEGGPLMFWVLQLVVDLQCQVDVVEKVTPPVMHHQRA